MTLQEQIKHAEKETLQLGVQVDGLNDYLSQFTNPVDHAPLECAIRNKLEKELDQKEYLLIQLKKRLKK